MTAAGDMDVFHKAQAGMTSAGQKYMSSNAMHSLAGQANGWRQLRASRGSLHCDCVSARGSHGRLAHARARPPQCQPAPVPAPASPSTCPRRSSPPPTARRPWRLTRRRPAT